MLVELYRLMAGHPDLAYVPRLTDRFPHLPQLAALDRVPELTPVARESIREAAGDLLARLGY